MQSDRCDGAATSRNRFGASTSRRPMGSCGRSVSPRCAIGRCRGCICSRSIQSWRPRRITTPMASGRCVRRRMRSSSVLSCSRARVLPSECWKATSSAASITSATNKCSTTSRWTRPSCAAGSRPATSRSGRCSPPMRARRGRGRLRWAGGGPRPEDRQIARFPGRHHATLPRRLGRPRDEKDRSWKKREGPRGCPYAPSQQPIRGRPISRAFY